MKQPCDEAIIHSTSDEFDCGEKTGRWVLAAAILGSSISFIDGTVVNVALPVLQRDLNASVSETQWVIESYSLMLSALILVGGSLGDRLGRRKIFTLGVLVFGITSVWCGLAPNAFQLIVARGVQGIGAAMLVPGSLALISANFAKKRRGRAIGTWSSLTAIAAGAGPVIGGWLIQSFSWRWIFFLNVPLVAAVLIITSYRVPESRDETVKGNIDWIGAGLATIGLGGVVFGLVESNSLGFRNAYVVGSLVVGALGLIAFVVVETRLSNPMLPLRLFRSKAFAGANLLTLFLYAGLGGLLFFLPFSLIQVQGYEPAAAGAALVPFVLTMFLLGRWAGGLVDRYGSKLPLVIGPLIAAGGFALFTLPGADAGSYWTSFFPAVMVMSFGMAISVAPLTTTVMSAVDEHHAGTASGINNAVSRTAGLIAVAAFGVVMLTVFDHKIDGRLQNLEVDPAVREQVLSQKKDLAAIQIPQNITEEQARSISNAIRSSFVDGFRYVALLAAGLAALSSLFAWLLIPSAVDDPSNKD